MKILFYATYPTLATGYARIGNILTNYLAEQGHDIYYLGISNFGDTNLNRFIHPNIKIIDGLKEERNTGSDELYAVNVIPGIIDKVKPDIFFIYNDIIVISRIFNKFFDTNYKINFKIVLYLDLVYMFEKIQLVHHINKLSHYIFVFSDCWKQNLIDMGIDSNKIGILPHGFDTDKFYPTDILDAKIRFGFNHDDFVILNSNRNNYRKCIDKTIEGFLLFLKNNNCNKKIKLFLNMNFIPGSDNEGYDIFNLIDICCIKYNLDYNDIINNHIFKNPSEYKISDESLNYLYNACNIGINTCVGEGFGLCNLEHGGIGKPQIVSSVGALKEIFQSDYAILIEPIERIYLSNRVEFHGGYIEIIRTEDIANGLQYYYDNPDKCTLFGNKSRETILNKYNWNTILSHMNNTLNNI